MKRQRTKKEMREYMKMWRKKNPERLKAHRKKNDRTRARRKHFNKKCSRQKLRYQAASEISAKMRGVDWTTSDDTKVMDYAKTARQLAGELGRTYWAIVARRHFLKSKGCES